MVVTLAATIGIAVALLSGGKDNGTTQNKSTLEKTDRLQEEHQAIIVLRTVTI